MTIKIVSRFAACCLCSASIDAATAAEIYKWTDANGQVHFGDRQSAPETGQKIDVPVQQPQPGSVAAPPSIQLPKGKSTPADPSQVRPGCQDLMDQIAKVKPGTNWQPLYRKFDAECPGIAYECNNYLTHPENNKCEWVKRTGNNVLHTNNYQ
jgi:hypothetical protein